MKSLYLSIRNYWWPYNLLGEKLRTQQKSRKYKHYKRRMTKGKTGSKRISKCGKCMSKILYWNKKIHGRLSWGLKEWNLEISLGRGRYFWDGRKGRKNEYKSYVYMCGANRRFWVVIHENPIFSIKIQVWSSVEGKGDHLSGNLINIFKAWHCRVH